MGLLQKAMETYDAMEALAGVYEEGKEPLAPIGHIVTKALIVITIDADGNFIEARSADKDQKIIIPATEKSAGRTKGIAAHPLCDKLKYLLTDDQKKYKDYMKELRQWARSEHSHPKVIAVLKYMERETLSSDLNNSGIPKAYIKKADGVVGWIVNDLGTENTETWKDKSLMKAYTNYYLSRKENEERQLCMITGERTWPAIQHIKGVYAQHGNAKIISFKDNANFTYRGRFLKVEEALSVGYVASQKAHNALKWLISNQGVKQQRGRADVGEKKKVGEEAQDTKTGGRAFVCWNPNGREVPRPIHPLHISNEDEKKPIEYGKYKDDLRRMIEGYKANWSPSDQVVIAAFDAATDGRLAVTYYNELLGSDFMDRLKYWDETCCWNDSFRGIYSPSLYKIVLYCFGAQREKKDKTLMEVDDKIIAPQMQRLLTCRIDQAAFPLDMMQAIVARAEQMQNYNSYNRNTLLFTACALIRKYYIDHKKEAFDLALEPTRKDRSYQWGRLLAVMEKAEQDAHDEKKKEKDKERITNAIRMQAMFVRRPAYTFRIVMEQLKCAYYPYLKPGGRVFYEKKIQEIMEQLSQYSDNFEKPLKESYLLGYYLQKNALYARKNDSETEVNDDEI